jgi:hypothetical protein
MQTTSLMVAGLVLMALSAAAAPLKIVEVAAPAINCVFDPSCTVTVTDASANIPLANAAGTAFLQSRTYQSTAGSPAKGRNVYEYRLDLRQAYGITGIHCITSLAFGFVGASSLDYNANGVADEQVFVVTQGGLGNVKPTSADRSGNTITFHFATPVCAGGSPGKGDSSYFFGLTSWGGPKSVTASLGDTSGPPYSVAARTAKGVMIVPEGR